MSPLHKPTALFIFSCLAFLFLNMAGGATAQAQQVQVTAADPPSAEQGSVNLNVRITGKGFKSGAQAKFLVTGTTDTGGVQVNSTAYVSSTELTANITVSDTAAIANFDIQVLNKDGRAGKGTELFAVTAKGANASTTCIVQSLPAEVSLLASLNYVTAGGTPAYGPNLGVTVRARQMTLNGQNVVVVGVGTPSGTGKLEIFFINPVTGQVLDGQVIGWGAAPQPHVTVDYGAGARSLAVGDVNADGVPDFVAGSSATGSVKAVVGSVSGDGVLGYQTYSLIFSSNAAGIGWGVAMGDLDGDGDDEIAAGATGGSGAIGQVSLFSFNGSGFTNTQNIVSPLPNSKKDENFGFGVAIADVTGDVAKDLIVGAPNSVVNKVTGAGRLFVFPEPSSGSSYLTFTTGVKNDNFGRKAVGGDVNGDGVSDLLATTGWSGTSTKAQVYKGLVSSGQSPNFILGPVSGLESGWSTTEPDSSDANGDALADVLIGAPNASGGSVCGGVTYLYLSAPSSPLATRLTLGTPELDVQTNNHLFGWATAFAPGTRLFFVTDQALNMGGTTGAGQVYVFKVN